MPQELPTQFGVALANEQTLPQLPQLATSLVRFFSQPSARLLALQSAKPALHTPCSQEPATQVRMMFVLAQTAPQPPQLLVSVLTLISQPSTCLLALQSAKPALQVPAWQEPPAQARATLFVEHTVPQLPQFRTSPLVKISQPSVCLLPLQSE